jgi:hypothetical protein
MTLLFQSGTKILLPCSLFMVIAWPGFSSSSRSTCSSSALCPSFSSHPSHRLRTASRHRHLDAGDFNCITGQHNPGFVPVRKQSQDLRKNWVDVWRCGSRRIGVSFRVEAVWCTAGYAAVGAAETGQALHLVRILYLRSRAPTRRLATL